MDKKEHLTEYLKRILDLPSVPEVEDVPGEHKTYTRNYIKETQKVQVAAIGKEYRNFLKKLNLSDERGGVTEELFLFFYHNDMTVSSFVNKRLGKENLKDRMNVVLSVSNSYYDNNLYPDYIEKAMEDMDSSDAEIYLLDMERVNCVTGDIDDLDEFLSDLDKKWNTFFEFLYDTISFACEYTKKASSFVQAVDQEIECYKKVKAEYYQTVTDNIYDGKNDNPFKNLYIYCLFSYIKDFYITEIPEITVSNLPDVEVLKNTERKETYTLQDVADAYAMITGENSDKVKERIKKQFQTLEHIQKFKQGKSYKFTDLLFPIITYDYFRKKNHTFDPQDDSIRSKENLVFRLYYPLCKAKMNGNYGIIAAYEKYRLFIVDEFKEIFSRVDDGYLRTFVDELIASSAGRLSLRIIKSI